MGAGAIVVLTSLAWLFLWYLIGIPAYRKGYHKGYFNGWEDHKNEKQYNNEVRK